MAYLSDPKVTIALLNHFRLQAKKKFGQNFLIDAHVIEKILRAADITKEDTVLEIGPGIGTLTQYLCEQAGRVIAVELDTALIPILKNETLVSYDNYSLIQGDILKLDLHALLAAEAAGRPVKVVANLPYYITTPILMRFLEEQVPVHSLTVMVQKEVADRMTAAPGTKEYGALSLSVRYYAEPYLAANVPQNCFIPRPTVGSAVIVLTRRTTPPVSVADERLLFLLIRAAFQQRRKTLQNALTNSMELPFEKEQILRAMEAAGLALQVRGETLSLSEFATLANALTAENDSPVSVLRQKGVQ